MQPLPSLFDRAALDPFLEQRGRSARDQRIFRRRYFREFVSLREALGDTETYDAVRGSFDLPQLTLVTRQDSALDGATKLLFRTRDGHSIETVILRIGSGRTSLCISSQVGCTETCTFCSTATLGFKRNLTLSEIVGQVHAAGEMLKDEGRSIRNVVFMGMGEPLRNTDTVIAAIEVLLSKQLMALSERRVTVSTIGICDGILRLREACPDINLAVSLHASNDAVRSRLMPVNLRFNMNQLRESLLEAQSNVSGRLMVQYLLIQDLNDATEQAKELATFLTELKPVLQLINLIPYNASMGLGNWQATSEAKTVAFQKVLQGHGYQVTRRHSLGQDIDAACGQLAATYRPEDRKHPSI